MCFTISRIINRCNNNASYSTIRRRFEAAISELNIFIVVNNGANAAQQCLSHIRDQNFTI